MKSSHESFCLGFNNVTSGRIKAELTNREIAERWPTVSVQAFAQGMIDALAGDKSQLILGRILATWGR